MSLVDDIDQFLNNKKKKPTKLKKKDSKRNFSNKITIRLNDQQIRSLEDVARRVGMKRTELIRYTLFGQRTTPEWIKWIDSKTRVKGKQRDLSELSDKQLTRIHELAVQITRLDNNINQLTRVANRKGKIEDQEKLLEELGEADKLCSRVLGELGVLHKC